MSDGGLHPGAHPTDPPSSTISASFHPTPRCPGRNSALNCESSSMASRPALLPRGTRTMCLQPCAFSPHLPARLPTAYVMSVCPTSDQREKSQKTEFVWMHHPLLRRVSGLCYRSLLPYESIVPAQVSQLSSFVTGVPTAMGRPDRNGLILFYSCRYLKMSHLGRTRKATSW